MTLKQALTYRFSRNASALLLLAVSIAAAGLYTRFMGEISTLDVLLDTETAEVAQTVRA